MKPLDDSCDQSQGIRVDRIPFAIVLNRKNPEVVIGEK
jgi:hypothetical protein